jgi:hypothetical protein
MTVARHEVPGKRLPKETSRRVRYDRALLIPESSSSKARPGVMFELLFDVMDPFPEHIDFFCFHIQNFVTPILQSPSRGTPTCKNQPYPTGRLFCGGGSQALRARLRSHCRFGTKSHSPVEA